MPDGSDTPRPLSDLRPCRVVTSAPFLIPFPTAWSATVRDDGCLIIIDIEGLILGAFAPGYWQSLIPMHGQHE